MARSGLRDRLFAVRGARAALVALFVLYALAVLAPFLASDLPYRLDAVDRGAYERARASLVPLAESYLRAAEARDEAAFERELAALEMQRTRLYDLSDGTRGKQHGGVWKPLFESGPSEDIRAARKEGAAFIDRVQSARDALRPFDPARPEAGGIVLLPRVHWPLLERLQLLDVVLALALPAVGFALFTRRKRTAIVLLALPLVGLGATAIHHARADPLSSTAIKDGIARGDIEVHSVVFAPIAMGYAETNLAESWRPPTWLASSTMTDDGRYTSGPRAVEPAIGAPIVRPGEPALNSPFRHVLGTDALGRDVLARVLWGARPSLAIGLFAALLLTIAGTLVGACAGFVGGLLDAFVARVIEVVQCFPGFFLVLCALAYVDPKRVAPEVAIALVIAAVGWTAVARIVRAETLRVRELELVLAARALGLSRRVILVRHVLPNVIGPAFVAFAFAAGGGILVESSLSFLGFGVQVPVPSWGALVGESRSLEHAWIWLAPGVLVFLAMLAYNRCGEALREALEPKVAVTARTVAAARPARGAA